MLTNDGQNFYSPPFFQHSQIIPTNKTNWNERKRSQTHTYELHNDGRRTQNEFYSIIGIRKYTQVDVGGCWSMCEGAIQISYSIVVANSDVDWLSVVWWAHYTFNRYYIHSKRSKRADIDSNRNNNNSVNNPFYIRTGCYLPIFSRGFIVWFYIFIVYILSGRIIRYT